MISSNAQCSHALTVFKHDLGYQLTYELTALRRAYKTINLIMIYIYNMEHARVHWEPICGHSSYLYHSCCVCSVLSRSPVNAWTSAFLSQTNPQVTLRSNNRPTLCTGFRNMWQSRHPSQIRRPGRKTKSSESDDAHVASLATCPQESVEQDSAICCAAAR